MDSKWVEVNNQLGHRFTLCEGDLGGHLVKRGRKWIVQVLTPAGDIYVHRTNVESPKMGRIFAETAILMLQSGVRTKAEDNYLRKVFKKAVW